MIDRFFACCDCKIYVDAGGRWAYWTLEDTGIVTKGAPISVEAVLSAVEYWNPTFEDVFPLWLKNVLSAAGYWNSERNEVSDWFYNGVFPSVRSFLKEHESHRIIFGDKEDFLYGDDENYYAHYFDWMQVGFLAKPSPRFFVEQVGLRTWDEVCDYVAGLDREISWLYDEELRIAAKRKFEELLKAKAAS